MSGDRKSLEKFYGLLRVAMVIKNLLSKTIVFASIVIIFFYIKSLVILYYFPIYPDEISLRVVFSRIFEDFPSITNVFTFCENFTQERPLIWYFPGVVEWLLHGQLSDFIMFRRIGLCFNLIIIALLTWQVMPRLTGKRSLSVNIAARVYWTIVCLGLILSLLSLGVLPVSLIINRHEQLIIPFLIVLLIIFPEKISTEKSYALKVFFIVIFFLCVSIISYAHPKTLFLAPVVILIGYRLFSLFNNRWVTSGLIILLISLILSNFWALLKVYSCKAAPGMESYLIEMNIAYKDIFYNWPHFQHQLAQSIHHSTEYLKKIGFQASSEINYLPPVSLLIPHRLANMLIRINLSALFLSMLFYLPFFNYRNYKKGKYFSMDFVLLVLFISICCGSVFNLTKHWYDVHYFWTILIIIFVFFIKDHLQYLLKNKMGKVILLYMTISGIFSLTVFILTFYAPLHSGYQGPGISLFSFDSKQTSAEIQEAINSCHISPTASENLILDDLTYLYLQRSQRPILITFVLLNYLFDEPNANFNRVIQQSNGLITRCTSLPGKSAQYTIHNGAICCVSKNNVNKVVGKIMEETHKIIKDF